MAGDDVRVVELVGRVVAGLRGELGGAVDHVLDVLRSHLGRALDRRDDVHVGAEGAHQLDPLLGEAVRDHDQRAVALRAADERERRPGAAARVLDHRRLRPDQPVALRALDHRERHPVLHRARRVQVLELHPELRAVLRRQAAQADERRAADRAEDVRPQRTAASPSSAFASAKKSGTGCTR